MPNPTINFDSSFYENEWWLNYDWSLDHPGPLVQAANPGHVQFSEWSQQMIATMYQNYWNSEEAKMARMIAAGINPYLAAQGIAGSGGSSGSVASPPPATPKDALPNALNSVGNLVASSGSAIGNVSNAVSTLQKLSHEIRNIDADTDKKLIDLGFTKNQTRAIGIQLKYMDYKERMSCFQALANYDNTKAQYDILKQDYENKKAELLKIIADTNLSVSEMEKNEAQKRLIQLQADWQQRENQFFDNHGYALGTPLNESIRDALVSGKAFDVNALGDLIANYTESVSFASENARARASWNFRPSNPYEAASSASVGLFGLLKQKYNDAKASDLDKIWKEDVDAAAEFENAYSSARDELEDTYDYYRRQYRSIRFSGASDTYKAQVKKNRDDAKMQLEEFTREKYKEIIYDEFAKRMKNLVSPE